MVTGLLGKAGFINLSTVDILGYIILCHWGTVLYIVRCLVASLASTLLWQSKMSPDVDSYPSEGKIALSWRLLWLEGRLRVYIFRCLVGVFLEETLSFFLSRGFGPMNWLKAGNWLRVHNSLLLNQVWLLFTTLLILIKLDISKVITYFSSRDITINYRKSKVSMGQTLLLTFSSADHCGNHIFLVFCD